MEKPYANLRLELYNYILSTQVTCLIDGLHTKEAKVTHL